MSGVRVNFSNSRAVAPDSSQDQPTNQGEKGQPVCNQHEDEDIEILKVKSRPNGPSPQEDRSKKRLESGSKDRPSSQPKSDQAGPSFRIPKRQRIEPSSSGQAPPPGPGKSQEGSGSVKTSLLNACDTLMYVSKTSFLSCIGPITGQVSNTLIEELDKAFVFKLGGAIDLLRKEVMKFNNELVASEERKVACNELKKENSRLIAKLQSATDKLQFSNDKNSKFRGREGQLLNEIEGLKRKLATLSSSQDKRREVSSSVPEGKTDAPQGDQSGPSSDQSQKMKVIYHPRGSKKSLKSISSSLKWLKKSARSEFPIWFEQVRLRIFSMLDDMEDERLKKKNDNVDLDSKQLLKSMVVSNNETITELLTKLRELIGAAKGATPYDPCPLMGDCTRVDCAAQSHAFKTLLKGVESLLKFISESNLMISEGVFDPAEPFSKNQADHIVNLVGPHCFDGMRPLSRAQAVIVFEFLLDSFRNRRRVPEAFRIFGLQAVAQIFTYEDGIDQSLVPPRVNLMLLGRELLGQVGDLDQLGLRACGSVKAASPSSGSDSRVHCCVSHSLTCGCRQCIRILTISSVRSGAYGWNASDSLHALHKATEDMLFLGDISSELRHLSVDTLTGLVNSGVRGVPQPLGDTSSESADSDSSGSAGSDDDDDDDEPRQDRPLSASKSDAVAAPEKSSDPIPYQPSSDPQPGTSGTKSKRKSKFERTYDTTTEESD